MPHWRQDLAARPACRSFHKQPLTRPQNGGAVQPHRSESICNAPARTTAQPTGRWNGSIDCRLIAICAESAPGKIQCHLAGRVLAPSQPLRWPLTNPLQMHKLVGFSPNINRIPDESFLTSVRTMRRSGPQKIVRLGARKCPCVNVYYKHPVNISNMITSMLQVHHPRKGLLIAYIARQLGGVNPLSPHSSNLEVSAGKCEPLCTRQERDFNRIDASCHVKTGL